MKRFTLLAITVFILILTSNIIKVKAQNYSPYATRIRFVSSNPLTCFPNSFYYNSVSKKLLVCSSLNTWTEVISASAAQYLGSNGTAALPTFSFTSDPDTGIFHSGTNTIGFTTNGVEKWVINSSGAFNPVLNNSYDIGNGIANIRDINIGRSLILYGSTSGNVNLKARAITNSYNLIWPAAQDAGLLINDGTGFLSWQPANYVTYDDIINTHTDFQVARFNSNKLEDSPIYADDSDIKFADNINVSFLDLTSYSALYLDNNLLIKSAPLNDGQILIGKTNDIPQAANITGSNGITITNSSNTIDISLTSPITFYSSETPTSISGGGGVLLSGSKNSAGKFTTTTTGANTITITFSTAFSHAPACVVTNETTANLARGTSTTTTLIFNGVTINGDTLSYICLGY